MGYTFQEISSLARAEQTRGGCQGLPSAPRKARRAKEGLVNPDLEGHRDDAVRRNSVVRIDHGVRRGVVDADVDGAAGCDGRGRTRARTIYLTNPSRTRGSNQFAAGMSTGLAELEAEGLDRKTLVCLVVYLV